MDKLNKLISDFLSTKFEEWKPYLTDNESCVFWLFYIKNHSIVHIAQEMDYYDDTWTATICGYLGAPENSFSFTIDSSELKNSSGLKTVCCMASYNQANIMSGGYVPLPFSVYHPQGSGKLSFRIALDSAPNSMRGFATNGLSTFIVGNTVYPYFTSMTVMYD